MNLESQVVSLELAKRLKELGVKQDSLFLWEYHDASCYGIKYKPFAVTPDFYNQFKLYSAFTVAELGVLLRNEELKHSKIELDFYNTYDNFCIVYKQLKCYGINSFYIKEENEANARAKMLIYLLENGLIENEINQKY